MKRLLALLALFALLLSAQSLPATQPLPAAQPQTLGFSPDRLERIHGYFEKMVADGRRAGAIVLIARDGKIADLKAFGYRDLEAKAPMRTDTICRIYSMSKIITTVAVLQLMEEGRFQLNDPVDQYVPELKGLKVFKGGTEEAPILSDPVRPLTIKHLLTHTSGMVYGSMGESTVHRLSNKVNVFGATSLKELVERAAKVPLIADPGEQFNYGISIDVLGYLVEKVSGMPFDQYVAKNITGPLGMIDTSFEVPEAKRDRLAKIYGPNAAGKLEPRPYEKYNGVPSGGGGLYSTTGDYVRFAQMLANGGQLNGTRILGRKTVELMMVNHLNNLARQTLPWSESDGFGLGGSVRIDLAKGHRLGSVGTFGWSGAATTYVSIDPKERTVVLAFTQYMPMDSRMYDEFSNLFYQSLVD